MNDFQELEGQLQQTVEEKNFYGRKSEKLDIQLHTIEVELDDMKYEDCETKQTLMMEAKQLEELKKVVKEYQWQKEEMEDCMNITRKSLEDELCMTNDLLEKEKRCRRQLECEIANKDQVINNLRCRM